MRLVSYKPKSLLALDASDIIGRVLGGAGFRRSWAAPVFKSRNSGSCRIGAEAASCSILVSGLAAGEMTGDVCKPSGISSNVSKTKKASPPSPSFIA